MAINDLAGQNIQDTYQKVVQTDGTNLADGTGSLLPISFDGNNVIISGTLSATEYTVTSSVTNVVFQQQNGSTIFGDSQDDTHQITGSLLLTGSFSVEGGVNDVNLELGKYIVGWDIAQNPALLITGSGLIISGATDAAHHPMIKVGDVELLDINNAITRKFLVHNVNDFCITSGSDGVDVTNSHKMFEHLGNGYTLYRNGVASITNQNDQTTLSGGTVAIDADLFAFKSQTYSGSDSSMWFPAFNTEPNLSPTEIRTVSTTDIYKYLQGNITASNISASGDLILGGNISASKVGVTSASAFIPAMEWSSVIDAFIVGNTSTDSVYSALSYHQYLSGRVIVGSSTNNSPTAMLDVQGDVNIESHITASGNISSSGTSHILDGDITIGQYIKHNNDANTYFGFTAADTWEVFTGGGEMIQINSTGTTFNVSGNDKDFKVAGNGGNLFILNDGANRASFPTITEFRIGQADATAAATLDVAGNIFTSGSDVGHITASGNISSSGTIVAKKIKALGSEIVLEGGHITASGNISASGTMYMGTPGVNTVHEFYGKLKVKGSDVTIGDGHITASGNILITGSITADGDISGSATSTGSFAHIVTQGQTIEFRDGGTKLGALKMTSAGDMTIADASSGKSKLKIQELVVGDGDISLKNTHITASGKVSASNLIVSSIEGNGPTTALEVNGYISGSRFISHTHITASGNISASDLIGTLQNKGDGTSTGNITFDSAKGVQFVDSGQKIIGSANAITIESDDYLIINADTDVSITTPEIKASGKISASGNLTVAQITASSTSKIGLRDLGHTEHTTIGTTAQGDIFNHGSTSTIPGAIYGFSTNGNVILAQSASTDVDGAGSIVNFTGSLFMAASANSSQLLLRGMVKNNQRFPLGNFGQPLYLSDNGSASVSPPTQTNAYARIIGHIVSGSGTIYFNPDNTWVKVS